MTLPAEPDGPVETRHTSPAHPFHESLVPPDQRQVFTVVVDGIDLDDTKKQAVEAAPQDAVGHALAEYSLEVKPLQERSLGGAGGGLVGLQFVRDDGLIKQLLPD